MTIPAYDRQIGVRVDALYSIARARVDALILARSLTPDTSDDLTREQALLFLACQDYSADVAARGVNTPLVGQTRTLAETNFVGEVRRRAETADYTGALLLDTKSVTTGQRPPKDALPVASIGYSTDAFGGKVGVQFAYYATEA